MAPPPLNRSTSIARLVAFLVVAVLLPAGLCRLFDYPANAIEEGAASKDFDVAAEKKNLLRSSAEWVLIGNSMLNTRIDHKSLTEISHVKARKVSRGGSQSALWFLFLKNVIVDSGAKPTIVTIFFRDTDLTWPDVRVEGLNRPVIDLLNGRSQPEWEQVFSKKGGKSQDLLPVLGSFLEGLFPATHLRLNARRQIQNRSFRLTRIGTKDNGSIRRIQLNDRFDLSHLRHDLGGDLASAETASSSSSADGQVVDPGFYEDGPVVFDPSPDVSFLPHIIAVAKQHQITLHFHRIKRRPLENHTRPDNAALSSYITALSHYLEKEGCLLTDESIDSALTLDMYADGDHISANAAIQSNYLQNFWTRVRPIVESRKSLPRSPAS